MSFADASILIIAGPSGSGKSALAMDLAEALGGVIINADSMQVYRELRVLTARPTPEDEARFPHRLFGVLSVTERCSAGRWLGLARGEIKEAWSTGRLPTLVGGTGLYLKALREGLAQVPSVPAEVRAEADALYARLGGERFRQELARLDPQGASRIAGGDRQRLVRAFEVAWGTGLPLSDWQRLGPPAPVATPRVATITLMPPRPTLYAALDARFEAMLANGAIEEVRVLLALDVDPGLPAMKALGVREIAGYLRGETRLQEATALAQQATRRFAKRQFTWFRHQLRPDVVISAQYSESFRPETFSFIRERLLTSEG